MRTQEDVDRIIDLYADMVQRICFSHLKNSADADDCFQNVFIRYLMYEGDFRTEEYRKAWLIRVAVNCCRDYLRTHFWRRRDSLESLNEAVAAAAGDADEEQSAVLEAVLMLPEKYKDVIYLFYYEDYSVPEISQILNKKEGTVYSLLSRGRSILKGKLGGEISAE